MLRRELRKALRLLEEDKRRLYRDIGKEIAANRKLRHTFEYLFHNLSLVFRLLLLY